MGGRYKNTPWSDRKKSGRIAKLLMLGSGLLLFVSMTLIGLGLGFPYWTVAGNANAGVFQTCTDGFDGCQSNSDLMHGSKFKDVYKVPLTWGLAIGGAVFLFVANLWFCCFPFYPRINACKVALAICHCAWFISGLVAIAALVILWPFIKIDEGFSDWDVYEYTGWAFYLTGSGVLVGGFAVALFIGHVFWIQYM